jgi:hypothetical protein
MPRSVHLAILPVMISPLKGRKTRRRNSTVFLNQFISKISNDSKFASTINIDEAITMTYEPIRNFEKIIHANAESNLLNNLFPVSDGSFGVSTLRGVRVLYWSISH